MTGRADESAYRFGHELNAWCHGSARVKQTSSLFDLPGRSLLGFMVIHDVLPEFIRRVEDSMPAEEIGARMRIPLSRPYLLQMQVIVESWLMGRERLIIDAGDRLPGDIDPQRDRADWDLVCSWHARVVDRIRADGGSYFPERPENRQADGRLMPGETVDSLPILDEETLSDLGSDHEPLIEDMAARVGRAFGAIELYAMTLHGEQRDGLNDHGPSRRPDGWSVVVHEINDLDNSVLPWSTPEVRLGVDSVGVVRAYSPEVELRFDMWSTVSARPSGPAGQTRALWVRRGKILEPLDVEELETIAARATAAMTALYTTIASWELDYRTAYGAPLFLNQLIPVSRLAGADDIEPFLWKRAAEVAARELPAIRGAETHPVWARLARTDTDVVFTRPR